MMPMMQLPSGVAIRADKILFIARAEINKYVAFMDGTPQNPFLTGEDLDVLRQIGCIQGTEPETKVEPLVVDGK